MKFDTQSYFESRDIEFWTGGKNVTAGWTNINCPFCDGGDSSNHCGISPHDFFNCYICGEKGHTVKLIRKIESCTFQKAQRIFDSFQHEDFFEIETKKDVIETSLPKECSPKFPQKYLNYLKKRRFDPKRLIEKYNLKCCDNIGNWKFRIIIPFYYNKQLATFSSVDVTGKQEIKYKHQSIKESVIDCSKTLYNIDSVKDKLILVEGVTDVWRIGSGACAITGKNITGAQINQIVRKNITNALVILDSDASDKGIEIAKKLSGIIPSVEYIELEEGDPCDFTDAEVTEIKKFLN